ncbi:MAG TPA: c-type cytochrome [Caulobacteraceae bacterium]|nr:c-type cytochrome [Caulobacteraceae bacterium]
MPAVHIISAILSASALAGGIAAAAAAPAPDAQRIAQLGAVEHGVPACQSCHGAQGEGVSVQNGPRLAHLDAEYLEGQLDAFATGERRHPVMGPIARALTADQRAALGAYFAALPPAAPNTAGSPSAREVARGACARPGGRLAA